MQTLHLIRKSFSTNLSANQVRLSINNQLNMSSANNESLDAESLAVDVHQPTQEEVRDPSSDIDVVDLSTTASMASICSEEEKKSCLEMNGEEGVLSRSNSLPNIFVNECLGLKSPEAKAKCSLDETSSSSDSSGEPSLPKLETPEWPIPVRTLAEKKEISIPVEAEKSKNSMDNPEPGSSRFVENEDQAFERVWLETSRQGMRDLVRETARMELEDDPRFRSILASKVRDVSRLSESEIIERFFQVFSLRREGDKKRTHESLFGPGGPLHLSDEVAQLRVPLPEFSEPRGASNAPPSQTIALLDLYSWRYMNSIQWIEFDMLPPAYVMIQRPSVLAYDGSFTPDLGPDFSFSKFVEELKMTSDKFGNDFSSDQSMGRERSRVKKWWTLGRTVDMVPFMYEPTQTDNHWAFDRQQALGRRNLMASSDAMHFMDAEVRFILTKLGGATSIKTAVSILNKLIEKLELETELMFHTLELEGQNWPLAMAELRVDDPACSNNFFVDRKVQIMVAKNMLEDYLLIIKFIKKLRFRPELMSLVNHVKVRPDCRVGPIHDDEYYQNARRIREDRRLMELQSWHGKYDDVITDPRRQLYPVQFKKALTFLPSSERITVDEDKRICFLFDFLF